MGEGISHKILLVEDEQEWIDLVEKELTQRGFSVRSTQYSDKALEFLKQDKGCRLKAAILDWRLEDPKTGRAQDMQGPILCDEILKLRPELPVFALTIVDDPREVATTSLSHRFTCFFPKRSLSPGCEKMAENYGDMVQSIYEAIQKMEDSISHMPTGKKWEIYRTPYLNLRRSYEWPNFEVHISNKAERFYEMYYESLPPPKRPLRDNLGVSSAGQPDIVNILIGRRVVFAAILGEGGAMHKVEEGLGYKLPDQMIDDDMKIYSGAFKTYLSEGLAISYRDFLNGKGILPEEWNWLERFCRANDIEFSFPLVR